MPFKTHLISIFLVPCISAAAAAVPRLPDNPRRQADEVKIVHEVEVGSVWAANMVSFDLHTVGDLQFVSYYDEDRMMTVAAREVGSDSWHKVTLPNKLRWDSHNYVTMGIDEQGLLHVSGNMHADPLVYFRSEKPYDISSMKELNTMLNDDEESVTYPKFFNDADGRLLFSYRSGTCGNGNVLVNRFDAEVGTWERYLTEPLFEGIEVDDDRAAYHKFIRDSSGNYHFVWIWRWNPLVETSHQICYATSPDLIHWTNAAGRPLALPFRPDNEAVIVDPVPAKGGSHNGRVRVILTRDEKPIVGYVKYDDRGLTQFYVAKPKGERWVSRQISDWDFRWEFVGGGDQMTIGGNFDFAGLADDGLVVVDWRTEKGESGRYFVDPDRLELVSSALPFKEKYPADIRQRLSNNPALSVQLHEGKGVVSESGARYVLKWEAMKKSHGRHAPEVIPDGPLGKLVVLEIE